MIASADGSSIRTVVDSTPHRYTLPYGYHADISPDGSQLIYTTCQFPTKVIDPVFTGGEWYHYEIASIRLDGGEPKRLTQNRLLDHVPVWSPDGTRIAYVADPPRPNFYYSDPLWKSTRLYTMAADGRDKRDVVPSLGGVILSPPEWSPDGQRLSFIVEEEGEEYQRRRFLYTVALDGSKLQRISEPPRHPHGLLMESSLSSAGRMSYTLSILTARMSGSWWMRPAYSRCRGHLTGRKSCSSLNLLMWSVQMATD